MGSVGSLVAKSVYEAGIQLWNPLIREKLRFLMLSQDWSLQELKEHQFRALRRLLEHAYDKSPFYRKRFDEAGCSPRQFKSMSDLSRVPTVSKDDLVAFCENIQIGLRGETLIRSETSGSSGKPLVFFRDASWDAWHRASVFRGYSWHGVQPWDRNGYLWGYNLSPVKRAKTRALDVLQNRFRLFSYDDREIAAFVRKLERAKYLGGYSSMIYEVAKRVNLMNPKPQFTLKMVKGTSEKINSHYQSEAKSAFGRRIISEYGAAEAGIIAFECPEGRMHINMETCVLEEVEKEAVVTNLVSNSFPIIRYRLGDYLELGDLDVCGCGRRHPAVREVLGRVGKVIRGLNRDFPSLTLYYVFKNLALEHGVVLSYQGRQSRVGYLEVHVEGDISYQARSLLNTELTKYYGQEIEVEIHENANLKSDKGKRQDFVSLLTDR